MILDGYGLLEFRSSERRRTGLGLKSYKHLTPNGVKTLLSAGALEKGSYKPNSSEPTLREQLPYRQSEKLRGR